MTRSLICCATALVVLLGAAVAPAGNPQPIYKDAYEYPVPVSYTHLTLPTN